MCGGACGGCAGCKPAAGERQGGGAPLQQQRACLPPPFAAGIALSPDGLRLAVGTDSGALSLLDLASRQYATLLRSHTAAAHCVALLGQGPAQAQAPWQYCTAGADGTVRVWEGSSHQQMLELSAPGEAVLRWAGGRARTSLAWSAPLGTWPSRASTSAFCRHLSQPGLPPQQARGGVRLPGRRPARL